jgi:cyanophycinase
MTVETASALEPGVRAGPPRGALVLAGGGGLRDTGILTRFIALAGGPSAPIVVIPTAREPEADGRRSGDIQSLMEAGARRLEVLHTRERAVADSAAFAAPLLAAGGVWFGGGRQWRLADAYLHTRTHDALRGVLGRGGVIGGTSAGATIQGSFLARGDTSGPDVMIGDHTEGLGFLAGVAVDQHWLARNRQFDLLEVVDARPDLLGLGIDEDTAVVVEGDAFEVLGRSYVGVFDPAHALAPAGRFYVLRAGDRFDLVERRATRPTRHYGPVARVIAAPERSP